MDEERITTIPFVREFLRASTGYQDTTWKDYLNQYEIPGIDMDDLNRILAFAYIAWIKKNHPEILTRRS